MRVPGVGTSQRNLKALIISVFLELKEIILKEEKEGNRDISK
uniref:Uncharacterized protein n=1 Tax=Pan troglodytes TaxID=9598 RepID=G2HG09_PANTR|nr:hypothetical protein [Pan troglodytes]